VNHLYHILKQWWPLRDTQQWLLVTVIETQGSSYRKPGAMMLVGEDGFQQGLISGGCLESDVLHQARRCWLTGNTRQITYDMQEENDIAWRLGIGCGGVITLLLQPVSATNHYLELGKVLAAFEQKQPIDYHQRLAQNCPAQSELGPDKERYEKNEWYSHQLLPPPLLLVCGGGVDAIPVIGLAAQLGWLTHVNDPRPRYARAADFPNATIASQLPVNRLYQHGSYGCADAVLIMHHQVTLDAKVIELLCHHQKHRLKYIGLLGPGHRTERVLTRANQPLGSLPFVLHSPVGLGLGGDLPESIALAMIAHIHAVLFDGTGKALAGTF
jgi:xanthine/CO dehydrogenase XdhC/CoxF family maturation factor